MAMCVAHTHRGRRVSLCGVVWGVVALRGALLKGGGSCQERIRMVGSCQDDQDGQEHQNPVKRPPGSWHPNNLLMRQREDCLSCQL